MTNLVPDVGAVNMRPGFEEWSSGYTSFVQHIAEFKDSLLRRCIVADSTGKIYDGTGNTAGSLLIDPIATVPPGFESVNPAQTHGQYHSTMFNNRLILVNGQVMPIQLYRTSSTTAIDTAEAMTGWTIGANSALGTAGTTKKFIGVFAFKERLFFWPINSSGFYYATSPQTIAGGLAFFDLSQFSGGQLVSLTSATNDGGDGVDDYFYAVMSTGQVLVYQGTDPGNPNAWALVGKYTIGTPVSRDAVERYGGQVIIATDFDYVTLPGAFLEAGFQKPTKLSGAAKEQTARNGDKDGWQIKFWPKGGWLVINVPQSVSVYHQHAINLRTSQPFKIEGWNGRCFGVFNGDLYFGGDGVTYKVGATSDDGAAIDCLCRQGFSDLGTPNDKKVARYRAMLRAPGSLTISTGLLFDYEDEPKYSQDVTLTPDNAGVAQWGDDWGTDWQAEGKSRHEWQAGAGKGTSISLSLAFSSRYQEVNWFRTDYVLKGAGNL